MAYFTNLTFYGVYDMKDPVNPEINAFLSEIEFYKVQAIDDQLCSFLSGHGPVVHDFSDPEAPVEISEIPTPSVSRTHIVERGDRLFLAGTRGLYAIDISEPDSPVTDVLFREFMVAIADYEDYLYCLSSENRFLKLDISDPETLGVISSFDFESGFGFFDPLCFAYENRFYIFDRSVPMGYMFTFTDSAVHATPFYPFTDLIITELSLFDIKRVDNLIIASLSSDQLYILDASTPSLELLSVIPLGPCGLWYFDIEDHYLYSGCLSLQVLDISCYTDRLKRGWNLVSYPFTGSTDLSFGDIVAPAYFYDTETGGYVEEDTLTRGKGYWVLADDNSTLCYDWDEEVTRIEHTLYPGWNLIGGPVQTVSATVLEDIPEIILPIYTFDPLTGSFVSRKAFFPFYGYFVLATDTVDVVLE